MKRWIYVLAPILVLGSLIGWRLGQEKAQSAEQAGMRAARMKAPAVVSLVEAQVRDITQVFEAMGSVESPQNVNIASKITGRIEMLDVREGDRVKKGQVLVRIDPSEIEAQVLQQRASLAEAQFRLAQAELNQTPTDVSVNTQIKQQKAALESSTADYKQVKESYKAQLAAAEASVMEAQAKVESAKAAIANAKAAVSSAQANLENARAKHDRVLELYKQGYIAAQDVDDAKASLRVHEANVKTAQGQLKSAIALHESALAQKQSAEHQVKVVKAKGTADIEAANAKMIQAQASLDYAKANTAQKPAYRQSLAALKASVEAAKASLAAAEARRRDTVLVSPLDGYVTGRYAEVGAVASAGQPIISVQFIKQVWVTIGVSEDVCSRIHIGQPAQVKFDAIPGRTFKASVIQINPSADLESRQFTVRVILSNEDNLFKPGMFARVSLETDRVKDMVCVPRETVKQDKTGHYVMVVDKGMKAKRVPVTIKASDAAYIAVEGISAGEKIVLMNSGNLRDGQMVRLGGNKNGGHVSERGEKQ